MATPCDGGRDHAMGDCLRESGEVWRPHVIVEHVTPPHAVVPIQSKLVAAPWLLVSFACGVFSCMLALWLARKRRMGGRKNANSLARR
jgi:hypothetical protein